MMIHRAEELEVINREEARRCYINYNRRGWQKQEPLDADTPMEEPRLARRAIQLVVEKSLIQRSQMVAESPFNAEDIETLS